MPRSLWGRNPPHRHAKIWPFAIDLRATGQRREQGRFLSAHTLSSAVQQDRRSQRQTGAASILCA